VVEKNGKIQNEINERIRKASKLYHLTKSILRNKDVDLKCNTIIYNVYFKKILLYGVEIRMYVKREENKDKQLR
jgi:hypothetical protein